MPSLTDDEAKAKVSEVRALAVDAQKASDDAMHYKIMLEHQIPEIGKAQKASDRHRRARTDLETLIAREMVVHTEAMFESARERYGLRYDSGEWYSARRKWLEILRERWDGDD